jgi:hypothetical protein
MDFFNKKHPSGRIFFIFFAFIGFVVYGFNFFNPDYLAYHDFYDGLVYESYEPGYIFLARLFLYFNFDFQIFYSVLNLLLLYLVFRFSFKWGRGSLFPVFFYISYPFFFDYIQTRNFIAEVVVLFSLYGLIFRSYSISRYLAGIGLAVFFHASSVFYIVFLIIKFKNKSFSFVFPVLICVLFCVVFFPSLLVDLNPKLIFYAYDVTSWYTRGFFASYFFTIIALYAFFMNKSLIESPILLRFVYSLLVFLPLLFIGLDFIRLYRNLFLLLGVVSVYIYYNLPVYRYRLYFMLFSGFHLLFVFFVFVLLLTFTDVVSPMFFSNYFFGIL